MRAPKPSEPKSKFPTYQVPTTVTTTSTQRTTASDHQRTMIMRGTCGVSAPGPPSVQQAPGVPGEAPGAGLPLRAPPVSPAPGRGDDLSVISGSRGATRRDISSGNSGLLNSSVTVPRIQRNGRPLAAAVQYNNNNNYYSTRDNDYDGLVIGNSDSSRKYGALLLLGRDIPNQKADENDLIAMMNHETTTITKINCPFVPPLRLRGGGESSLSTGTTGWGTPPSQQASNNNGNNSTGWGTANPANQNNAGTQQWNNNSNRTPNSNQGPASQDNKTNQNMNSSSGQQPPAAAQPGGWGPAGAAKVPQGPQSVVGPAVGNANGPSGSAVVPSQQPPTNAPPTVVGPAGANTSTKQQLEQLNSMREAIYSPDGWGVQQVNQDTNWDVPSSPEPSMKLDAAGNPQPWKPSVNNGTELWEANLRNGGQPPPQPQQKVPWGHTPSTNIGGTWGEDDDAADSTNVWTGVPAATQPQWGQGNGGNNGGGGGGGGASTYWGQGPKKENEWASNVGGAGGGGAGWGDPRSADPRTAGLDPRDMRPELRIRGTTGNAAAVAAAADGMRLLDPREQMRLAGGDMRGDPRGITGRLNGAGADAFWSQAGPHGNTAPHMPHPNKMPGGPGTAAGWEEPSPPTTRRNMPNYDDGTSFWGNPQQGGAMGRGGSAAGPPGMAPRVKPDVSVWGHAGGGRNGSWDEGGPGGGVGGGGWDDNGPWPKQKMGAAGGGNTLWDNELDWTHKQPVHKQQLTKEMIWNSKQFRSLIDMGYKKEDVENALRSRDMNADDALEILSPIRNQDGGWGVTRHDDHYDHPQFSRYPSAPNNQMSFPPKMLGQASNVSATGPGSVSQGFGPSGVSGAGRGGLQQPQSTGPSTQQLRMLVQQIQMAVQAGYLNHQILNQPLAPHTLILLNQLLQQIKTLQQLANQQQLAQSQCLANGKPASSNNFLQCSVLITKTKQHITNLQNQIAAQQAQYVKQHQQLSLSGGGGAGGGGGGGGGGPVDLFKSNPIHESLNALQGNFADLNLKDSQVDRFQQQSRLNQWINKDKEDGNEFSRAPGSSSKPMNASPNIPLSLAQPDGPWSSGRTGDGWPENNGGDSSVDTKDAQWPTPSQPSLTDLVPEFEPGKPWKGNQIKSIEDDPSITPGSVVRSPLSIASIKDSELFNINSSKTPPPGDSIQPLSLTSSTWSFNPPASTTSAFTSPQSKIPSGSKALDLNPTSVSSSEVWGSVKSRGPPPGLSSKGGNALANGWSYGNLGGGGSTPWGPGGHRGSGSWGGGNSCWLLLRNLTAQIDGSTLRTLCMQHGPVLSFHLYLHQGFALAKYATREEAAKAQSGMNNCVLGNTSILAENPTDWDATALLQQVASQPGGGSGAWRSTAKQAPQPADTWSTGGWPSNPSTAALWGSAPLGDAGDPARATPSSLNSFLPGDLLGGESM